MRPPSKQRTEAVRKRERDYYARTQKQRRAYAKKYAKKNPAKVGRWRANNPARFNEARRKAAGLPEPTRPCPALCERCGKPPQRRAMHLDHDHTTGRFRGWLCHKCNVGIGLLGDNIEGLQSAIEYLQK